MERIDEEFARYWEGLGRHLTARLRPMTLSFFSGVPSRDAGTVADLVGDGKKLRGCLVLAVCDALGGSLEQALTAAVAVECVQAASLIHDDLVDHDAVRRERPATWVMKGGRRAVLLGDLIFATALHKSAEAGREEVRILAKAIALMAAGAYREPLDVGETDAVLLPRPRGGAVYEHIIQAKTGALFAAAAELGAVAAAAPPSLRAAAAVFGARLGEAYQMADDLADLVSLPDAAALSPQQSAALAVLVDCLGADARETRPGSTRTVGRFPNSAGGLADSLQRRIGRRLSVARRALEAFPEGPRLAFLRALPGAIVRPAAASAQPAPPGPSARSVHGEPTP